MTSTEIPNRAAFKSAEVCAIAALQPYVLRTWEAEFPDLGVASSPDGPRIYRKADIERVLRLKHLILVEGLTLAGARRKIVEADGGPAEPDAESLLPSLMTAEVRKRIGELKRGLEGILQMLSADRDRSAGAIDFSLKSGPGAAKRPAKRKSGR